MIKQIKIYGQERIRQNFDRSLSRNRQAHAYLLHGQPGIGKDGFGLEIAMRLLCDNPAPWACGECPSCQKIKSFNHPAFHFIMPVPSRPSSQKQGKYDLAIRERQVNRLENYYKKVEFYPEYTTLPVINIDQIRQMKHDVILKTAGATYRIFLISQVHLMSIPAANSLLKLLEEPPPQTILILTTSQLGQVLGTIKSRCQLVRFDSLNAEIIEHALTSRFEIDAEKAAFFARMAGGSLERALELTSENFTILRKRAISFLVNSFAVNTLDLYTTIDEMSQKKNKQQALNTLYFMQMIMRDILQIQLNNSQLVVNSDKINQLQKITRQWPAIKADQALNFISCAIDYIGKNMYLPLILANLSEEMQLCNKQDKKHG